MAGASRHPHPALAPYVEPYVGYDEVMAPDAVHHGVPAAAATVILDFDEPLDVGWLHDPGTRDRHWTLASGLHLAPALIHTHGRQHGIQLALTPLGVRALLGVPVATLSGELVGHDDLPGGLDAPVLSRLAEAPGWDARFDLLDLHLLGVLRRARDPRSVVPAEVAAAWRLLARVRGRARVDWLADEVGWSRRHLTGRFTAEYGVTPKEAARLMRFEHARGLTGQRVPLAEVALEAGYADQAHLAREWRRLAGQPASATLREQAEQFPFVQDMDDARVASSPA